MPGLVIHVEFGGGAELLFGKVKHHNLQLPDQHSPWSLRNLIVWIRDNLLKVKTFRIAIECGLALELV